MRRLSRSWCACAFCSIISSSRSGCGTGGASAAPPAGHSRLLIHSGLPHLQSQGWWKGGVKCPARARMGLARVSPEFHLPSHGPAGDAAVPRPRTGAAGWSPRAGGRRRLCQPWGKDWGHQPFPTVRAASLSRLSQVLSSPTHIPSGFSPSKDSSPPHPGKERVCPHRRGCLQRCGACSLGSHRQRAAASPGYLGNTGRHGLLGSMRRSRPHRGLRQVPAAFCALPTACVLGFASRSRPRPGPSLDSPPLPSAESGLPRLCCESPSSLHTSGEVLGHSSDRVNDCLNKVAPTQSLLWGSQSPMISLSL